VASFEARQVKAVKDFVEREGIDCDFEETEVMDVCFYEAGRNKMKADLALLAEADISTVRDVEFFSGHDVEEVRSSLLWRFGWRELTCIAGLRRQGSKVLSYI